MSNVSSNSISNSSVWLEKPNYLSQVWNKFDDVQPYLEHIEHMIYDFIGTQVDVIPKIWTNNVISRCIMLLQSNAMSVQEAVTSVLQEYRFLVISHFRYCRETNSINTMQNEKRVEIIKMMANFESAIWENEWYQLMSQDYSQIYKSKDSNTTCVNNNNIDTLLVNDKQCKKSLSNNTVSNLDEEATLDQFQIEIDEIPLDSLQIENSTNCCATNNCDDIGKLMTDGINEDVERQILHELSTDDTGIGSASDQHGIVEEPSSALFMGKTYQRVVFGNGICNNQIAMMDQENNLPSTNKKQDTKKFSKRNSMLPPQDQTWNENTTEILVFTDSVKRKCRAASRKLTKTQKGMLKQTVGQYRDMVQTHTLSLSDALQCVYKMVDYLALDKNNTLPI